MFKPEKIFRTVAIIPRDSTTKTISALYKNKVCQIKESENELNSIEPVEDEQRILNLYSRLEFVMENLEKYSNKSPPNVLKELFSKKRTLRSERKTLAKEELYSKTEQCLDIIEETVKTNINEIKKIEEKRNKNNYLISNLYYLPDITTSSLESTENLKKIMGIVNNSSIERIKEKIKDKAVIVIKPIDKKISLLIAIHPNNGEIESFLHEIGFGAIKIPYENLKPIQIINRLKEENQSLSHENKKILKELHSTYIYYHKILEYFHDELKMLKEKIDALSLIGSSNSFAVLECWIPEKNIESFQNILKKEAGGHYTTYNERDDAPTLLNNPKIIKPFESITELYSLPKYKSTDPTPILAITFSFFFGFMLTDFVYGSILLALGLLLIRGKGSYDEKTKNIGIILSTFGVFTLLLGMVFGSYFGDFFQQLGFNVPSLLDSMNQVMIVLIVALAIGTIHLLTALVVGFIENTKKAKILDAMQKQGVWIMFILSLIAFIFKLTIPGYVLLGSSLITQIALTFKEGGGISSVLSIFSFPSFIGDLFSYGRLMALAIGTTGIALAVNFMTLMAWDMPYVGPVAAILIFIIGHLFNMAMNGLGAFVHSIRLHFLEFFSKFYEGSGKKYIPFGTNKNQT